MIILRYRGEKDGKLKFSVWKIDELQIKIKIRHSMCLCVLPVEKRRHHFEMVELSDTRKGARKLQNEWLQDMEIAK